jgi:hypothetical protein
MYMTMEVLDPRFFWPQLPLLGKFYALFLCAVALYALFSLSRIMFRLKSLARQHATGTHLESSYAFALLRKKSDNLHQLIFFATLLFGLTFFFQFPAIFLTLGDSKSLPWSQYLENLAVHVAFATDVLFVLVFLHSAQWLVSARLRATEIRLHPQTPTNPAQS